MSPIFYHNPRCSKSRQALALLQEKGVAIAIVDYLKTPPDSATLQSILSKLGIKAADLTRRKEAADLGLVLEEMTDQEIIAAMTAHPILIERPILITATKATIGRPPEKVLEIVK